MKISNLSLKNISDIFLRYIFGVKEPLSLYDIAEAMRNGGEFSIEDASDQLPDNPHDLETFFVLENSLVLIKYSREELLPQSGEILETFEARVFSRPGGITILFANGNTFCMADHNGPCQISPGYRFQAEKILSMIRRCCEVKI